MEIRRDTYLQQLIDKRNDGMIKVETVEKMMMGNSDLITGYMQQRLPRHHNSPNKAQSV